jgi:hypothetical protein
MAPPPPSATSSIYVSTTRYSSGYRPPPAIIWANVCGREAQHYCNQASRQEYQQCGLLDCEGLFCSSPATNAQCTRCVANRTTCQQAVLDKYEYCGVCHHGETCQTDLGTAYGSGYHFCCPSELSPCNHDCVPTGCGIGNFDKFICECDCPAGTECLGDDGGVRDCCDRGETCSHGHCCKVGQTWISGRCCDNDHICEGICCDDEGRHCDQGHCCEANQRWIDVQYGAPPGAKPQCCDTNKICKRASGTLGGVPQPVEDCCPSGYECAADPRYPGFGFCCPTGKIYCRGSYVSGCCDPGRCCGNEPCCTGNKHCSHEHCCPPNNEWAFSSWPTATSIWMRGACCPTPASGKTQKFCGSPQQGSFRCCDQDQCCKAPNGEEHCCAPLLGALPVRTCCPDGVCADLKTDPKHCGACSNSCPQGQDCVNGACDCPSTQTKCGIHCCDRGYQFCCGTECCPQGRICCGPQGNRQCCELGLSCNNNICSCLDGRPPCPGVGCCPSGATCTNNLCVFPCNSSQRSGVNITGANVVDTRVVNLGRTAGTFQFTYDTFNVPDLVEVIYEGRELLGETCRGTGGSFPAVRMLQFSGTTPFVIVRVTANCDPTNNTGLTDWQYQVDCP